MYGWISDFDEALIRGFEPWLLGEALITLVVTAVKGPLNATNVAGNAGLMKAFEKTLTSTLEFLPVRDAVKGADPAIKAQTLIRG